MTETGPECCAVTSSFFRYVSFTFIGTFFLFTFGSSTQSNYHRSFKVSFFHIRKVVVIVHLDGPTTFPNSLY